MSFKRNSWDLHVGERECSEQSRTDGKCNFCGERVPHPHKKNCPGNYVCTLCGHMKTDHLDLKPCTPNKNMCLCPRCKYYVGSSPNPQKSSSSFSQPSNSSYQSSSSTYTQPPGFFQKLIALLLIGISGAVGGIAIFIGVESISYEPLTAVIMLVPIVIGFVGANQGSKILKGGLPKFPIGKVILIFFLEASMGCGITWFLMNW